MIIKILSDFRGFKAGETIDWSIADGATSSMFITVVGENGCGKTALLGALRGKMDKDASHLLTDDFIKLGKNIEVTHHYEKLMFFDTVADDGNNFMVSFDASAYIDKGGHAKQSLSHGQGSLSDLNRFIKTVAKDSIPGKTLVVLDEADKGLSLKNQSLFMNVVHLFTTKYNCDVLFVTHNPFAMCQSIIVYDMAERKFTLSESYISKITGYTVRRADVDGDAPTV